MEFSISRILFIAIVVGTLTYHFKFREKPAEEKPRQTQTSRATSVPKVAPMQLSATPASGPETTQDIEENIGKSAKSTLVSSLISRVSSAIGIEEAEKPEDSKQDLTAGFATHDPELDSLLKKSFGEIFLRKVGSAFTRRKNGDTSTTVQLAGLQLDVPINARLSAEEKENNIQERIFFPLQAEAWREYRNENWGAWNPSKPPLLSGFTFEKREGSWEVISTPAQWYSLQ